MSLLISNTEYFEIIIKYKTTNGKIKLSTDEDAEKETFYFKRPDWHDTKKIASIALTIVAAGQAAADPYKYMDIKIKTLLKDWTLKTGESKIPLNNENIDKLDPSIMEELFSQLETKLSAEN